MISQKSLLHLTSFSLALSLGISALNSLPTFALEFQAPNVGKPSSTAGGGTRGTSCITNKKNIVPLIPTKSLALTVERKPKFFVYIPASSAKTASFTLIDKEKDEVVYEQTLTISGKPGIVTINIPEKENKSLEVGKTYYWYADIICNALDPEDNPSVEGWVKRIQPDQSFVNKLQKTAVSDRPAVYAKAGIWQETITTLAQLRRSRPNDNKVATDWEQLLKSVGLSEIAKEPLVDCCQAPN